MNKLREIFKSNLIKGITNGLPIEEVAKLNNVDVDEMKKRLSDMADCIMGMQLGNESNDTVNESKDMSSTEKVTAGIPIAIVAKEFNMTEEDIKKYYPQYILSAKVNNAIREKEIEEMNKGIDHDGDVKPEGRRGETLFDTFRSLTKKQLEEFTLPTGNYATCKHKHLCDPEKREQCKKSANSVYGAIAMQPHVIEYLRRDAEITKAIEEAFDIDDILPRRISTQRIQMLDASLKQFEKDMDIIFNRRNPSIHVSPFITFRPIEDILKPGLYKSFDWDGDVEFEGAYVADPKNPIMNMDERVEKFHKKLFDEDMSFIGITDIIPNALAAMERLLSFDLEREIMSEEKEESVYEVYDKQLEDEDRDPIYKIITTSEEASEKFDEFMGENLITDDSLDIRNILNLFLAKCSYERPLNYLLRSEIHLYSMLVEDNDLCAWRLDLYKDKVVINGIEEITERNFVKLAIWLNKAKERATKICIVIHE